MSLQKKTPLVLQRKLAERLSRVLPSTVLVTQGFDASGNPQIVLGDATPATSEQNFYIRIIENPVITGVTDSTGNTAQSYGPHVVQVAMENTASAGIAFPSEANKALVLHACILTGCRVEIYLSATTVVPVVGTLIAANLVQTLDADLMFGLLAGR